MKLAVRQSFVEILGVDGRDDHVSAAGNDLHRRLYVRQDTSEYFKLRRVGLPRNGLTLRIDCPRTKRGSPRERCR